MTEPIEPALTPAEWRKFNPRDIHTLDIVERPEILVAIGNFALPDSDPRKITRETVKRLRALADHLESYLPPEGQ